MHPKRPYHITQPDSLGKREQRPCLCGSADERRVAFALLRSFLAASMVKPEDRCKECYDLYQAKKNQTPW